MLQLRETRIVRSLPERIAPGVSVPEEGIPLTYVKVDGVTYVQPAVSGGMFAGVSLSRSTPPMALPMVTTIVGDAAGGKFLRAPIVGQLLVKDANGDTRDVVTAAPAAGEIQVDAQGNWVTHASDAGVTLTAQFHYTPSVTEALSVIGDVQPGGLASAQTGDIGALKQATISTNFFNASADWSTVLYVTVSNGMFVPGNAGDHIVGAVVRNAPSADDAFLGLSFNVA